MSFPLKFIPKKDWHKEGRQFGASRQHGHRKHAGCDLIAPVGTPVYAVADGKVALFRFFYDNTWYIHIEHEDFEVRYGEVKAQMAPGISVGSAVKKGDHIGWVGFLKDYSKKSGRTQSMLHLEMFAGTVRGPLRNEKDPRGFQRRSDLIDPTKHVDQWAKDLLSGEA
jgi:murein DD-endopeptidase MepM/ murein hydrolase activator NlpD